MKPGAFALVVVTVGVIGVALTGLAGAATTPEQRRIHRELSELRREHDALARWVTVDLKRWLGDLRHEVASLPPTVPTPSIPPLPSPPIVTPSPTVSPLPSLSPSPSEAPSPTESPLCVPLVDICPSTSP